MDLENFLELYEDNSEDTILDAIDYIRLCEGDYNYEQAEDVIRFFESEYGVAILRLPDGSYEYNYI